MRVRTWMKRSKSECCRVKTLSGVVEGKQFMTKQGFVVNAFLGIPYAKPPLGELRFKKTEPIEPWSGVLKCQKYQSRAPQNDYFWDRFGLKVGKNEDCLYLNIITPSWEPTTKQQQGFPVMFYIHGGGFLVDSAVKYNYKNIARLLVVRDVIVVTIQYRLGYLGFFTTNNKHCLGNFGLWDQVTALKWTKENIVYFGGDPSRITVVGQSAGGACADLLTLSPYTQDLFHQVVLLGGNADCSWAIADPKQAADYCRKHAKRLGWEGTDDEKMLNYLRSLPADKLADGMIGNRLIFSTGRLPLTPVVDGDLLPTTIREMRKNSRTKRSLIGVTEDEGMLFVAMGRMACDTKDIEMGIRLIADAVEGSNINANEFVKSVYLNRNGDTKPRKALKRAFVDMLSDLTSNYGASVYVNRLVNRDETVYMFSLEHCNPACYGLLNLYLPYRTATHGVELIYLFDANIYVSPFLKTSLDRRITDMMTQQLTNFIKSGDPNVCTSLLDQNFGVIWQPATKEANANHLRISRVTSMRSCFKNGRMEILKNIFGDIDLKC